MVYLIGSLRNSEIPVIANRLREAGLEVFDDWYAAGPNADDCWRDYEKARGHNYRTALQGYAADNVFGFDKRYLDRCRAAVLVLPAGRSGHLELGYVIGSGRPGYILLDEDPERFDVMYRFAAGIFSDTTELIDAIKSQTNIVDQERYTSGRVHATSHVCLGSCACLICLGNRGNMRGGGTMTDVCQCQILGKRCVSCKEWDEWRDIQRVSK